MKKSFKSHYDFSVLRKTDKNNNAYLLQEMFSSNLGIANK